MKNILLATDFSTRSDRALRRACILAKTFGATITLLHVIDDDQPQSLIDAEQALATALLDDQVKSLRELDHIDCSALLKLGDPFDAVLKTGIDRQPDVIVLGSHRRHLLMDVIVGTTAERIMRQSRWPVLMAISVPAAPYRHALVAVDFSPGSHAALECTWSLGLGGKAAVSVLHVYDAPAVGLMLRTTTTSDQIRSHIDEERKRAEAELTGFLGKKSRGALQPVLKFSDKPVAAAIRDAAQELNADLLILGSHGRSGAARLLLGSVTDAVLKSAEVDVLVVPSNPKGEA